MSDPPEPAIAQASDRELFARLTHADPRRHDALTELQRRHARRVRLVVTSILSATRHRPHVEDVVQALWQKLLERPPSRVDDPIAWLVRIAKNAAIDERRRIDRRGGHMTTLDAAVHRPTNPDDGPLGHLLAEERRSIVRDCVQRLPETERQLARLRWFENLKLEAIAERMERAVSSIQERLQRTLDTLRRCVEGKLS